MILNVIIEPTDPIEMHQHWESMFLASEGGMIPVEFAGNFRFQPGFFEVEQQHKSQQYFTGRTTRFKLHLVNQI
jgi:hypothetical protein